MSKEFLILVAAYLAAINIVTFGLFAYDKWCAQHDRWRVRESTLLFFAAIGGAIGAGVAMEVCHHKTLHAKFKFGVPLLLFVQIIFFGLLVTNPDNIIGKILSR